MITLRTLLAVGLLMGGLVLLPQSWAGGKKKVDKKDVAAKETIVNGELIDADEKDKVLMQSYCKTYTFKMAQGKTYQIDLVSKVFDSFLRLENAEGNQVAQDDDSGGNLNARILYRAPKAGDYKIVATSLGTSTGKFTLTVKEVKSEVANGKPIDLKFDKGQASRTANLLGNDPRYMGKAHKLFQINLEAGKTYQIDMKSKAFDSYLFLEGPDGDVLAKDDDSGGFPDARIIHKAAKTGKHRIIATCFGGGAGEFTLTINEKKE